MIGFIWLGPSVHKTRTDEQKLEGGRENAARSEGCLARKVSAIRSCAPHSKAFGVVSGVGIQAVCPSDRPCPVVRGPAAVGKGPYHRTTMISSENKL